jgi:hypothetical protein
MLFLVQTTYLLHPTRDVLILTSSTIAKIQQLQIIVIPQVEVGYVVLNK